MSDIIRYSTALKTARLQAVLSALDGTDAPSTLTLYKGPAPDSVGPLPVGAQALVRFTLPRPCGTIEGGELVLGEIGEQMVMLSGVPTFARFADGAGLAVMDLDVSVEGGGGAVQLVTLDLVAGGLLRLKVARIIE